MNNQVENPKVIRVFGSLYDLFFGEGFDEEKWTRVSIKGDQISHVKGREINWYFVDYGKTVMILAASARERYFSIKESRYVQ